MTSRRIRTHDDDTDHGFTLVEVIAAIAFFALLMATIFPIVYAMTRTLAKGQADIAATSDARSTLNRMTRELREADKVQLASSPDGTEWIRITVDFNADGTTNDPSTTSDEETIEYVYDSAAQTMSISTPLTNPAVTAVLAENITSASFTLLSSNINYDWSGDGVTTWQEVDAAVANGISGVGDNDGVLDTSELDYIDIVKITMTVATDNELGGEQTLEATVKLRNYTAP